ncbi:MAG: HAD family hydrolase [Elusimicrobia bacterium]|nr:HAD family hydrolase [Elusimicrobiota bacterium]
MSSILFDYGGTLDADGVAWLERFHVLYKECGVDIPRERFDRAFYDADDALCDRHALAGLDLEATVRLQARDVLAAAAPEFLDRADEISARFAADSRRHFARLLPTLERLARSRRFGIVSNFYGNLDGLLRAEGLRDLFGVVADSGALGAQKPDPAIFLHAAHALDSLPQDCVMVGDSIARDVRGAAAAGMMSVLVCAHEKAPAAGQSWTVRSVAELETVLS